MRRSEEKYRSLFENMGCGCCVDEVIYEDGKAVDYRILDANPAYERIVGISRDRAVGALGSEVYGDGLPSFFNLLTKVAETGEPASFERYFAPIEKHLQFTVNRPGDGRFSMVFTDITDRVHAQEELAEASRRLREAVRAGNVGLWDWNLATNRVQYSPEWKRQIGYDEHEITDSFEEWQSRVHPEDLAPTLARVHRAIAEGSAEYFTEFRFRHKDGSYRYILSQSSVFCGEAGRPSRVLGSRIDITEHKRAEEALNRQRAELQAIYDHAPVMMSVLDPDRRVLYTNRAFTEFTGVSEDELTTGRACGVFGCINAQADPRGCGFGPVCERCELRRALDDTLRTGLGHRNVEYRATLERQGNRRAVVLLGATAAIQTDGQSNVLLCLEDRTEQEQAEQRARQRELELLHVARLSTLGEMASGLAHELSQPLSSIVNYSTACAQLGAVDRPDLQRIMKNIHKITEQAERARDIMVRIRELAQRRRPRLTSVDVNRVVANVLDLLAWQIRQKGIDLNPDLDDRLPAARADAIQVEQVLVNLTRNAIEAMEQTPPRRRLTIRTSPGDAGAVRIEVSDTGVGIPRDEPDRIFDAFCTTKADGLGIGLSISRTIVEMHEGILQADRNAEGGSTFVVVLPQVPRQDATEGRDEDWQRDASHGMPWLSRSANGSLKKMAGSIR
ncbi:MAG: PAS domain S-box protein [Planctomycetota bacterium]|nr:PAS domain S-box protein [Planctomycetota bacterium]